MSLKDDWKETLNAVYEAMEGSEASLDYSERHNIRSAAILTIADDETAAMAAEHLAPQTAGKTVVEIGGGIGLLALHMGRYATRVYCIEANPMWSWVFAGALLRQKPKNVSFLFGSADEFLGCVKGDVALFCTHSDVKGMSLVAAQFAPLVIDVWGEIIEKSPEKFDQNARHWRTII